MKSILEKLKYTSANIDVAMHLGLEDSVKGATMWPNFFVRWVKPQMPMPGSGDPWRDKKRWIWKGVVYNSTAASIELGTNYAHILKTLKEAYGIYPDGTYNQSFIEHLIQINKENNHD